MEQVKCQAKIRKTQGKGAAHQLRERGFIPAVLYSRGGNNQMLCVAAKELDRILATKAGANVLVNLEIEGGAPATAMINEVQRDTFQRYILHVDFHGVSMDEKIRHELTLAFHGPAKGEKEGGMVDHIRNTIEIEATPAQMPAQLDVDVTSLGVGESLHVRDLKLPAGVVALTDGDEMVVVVHAARTQDEAPAEGADATLGAPVA